MARRVVAGMLGGVAGILPLVLVNLLVNAGGALGAVEALAVEYALALGIVALLGGVLAGGWLAGWLATRGERADGSVGAAGVAGALAATLYAVTVILVLVGGARQGWGPPVAAIHPIRVSAAILLVACLLLGIALATGALVGRGRLGAPSRATTRQPAARTGQRAARPGYGQGYRSGYGPGNARRPGNESGQGYDQRDSSEYGPRPHMARPPAARSYDRDDGTHAPAMPARPRAPGPPQGRDRW